MSILKLLDTGFHICQIELLIDSFKYFTVFLKYFTLTNFSLLSPSILKSMCENLFLWQ